MKLDYTRSTNRVTKPRAFSLDDQLFLEFAAMCEREGRKQNRVLEALMRLYLTEVDGDASSNSVTSYSVTLDPLNRDPSR